jgi:hypothetical protein
MASVFGNGSPLHYTAKFPLVPRIWDSTTDFRFFGFLMVMHSCVPLLWEATDQVTHSTKDWTGWLFAHLTVTCLPNLSFSVRSGNPFRFKYAPKSKARIAEMLVRLGLRDEMSIANSVIDSSEGTSDQDVDQLENSMDEVEGMFFSNNEPIFRGVVPITRIGQAEDDDNDSLLHPSMFSDDIMGEKVQSDGAFHPEDVRILFANHPTVSVTHAANALEYLEQLPLD